MRNAAALDPAKAEGYARAGDAIQRTVDAGVRAGVGSALGCFYGPYWNNCWYWPGWSWCWYGGAWPGCWWSWCWSGGFPYSSWCHPLGWSWWGWYGWWPSCSWWGPSYSWWSSGPGYYSTVVYHYVEDPDYDDDPDVVIYQDGAEEPEVQVLEGEASAAPAASSGLSAEERARLEKLLGTGSAAAQDAVQEYLGLGDRAFLEKRYADAVHFYAKAIEFSPAEGRLYLILADGLLATGDYHYGAYAIRRALELEATLVDQPVDKHQFYGSDPLEFDRQLAVLESYVQDHPTDPDARLMLVANYLFGARPAAAVDMLDSDEGATVRREAAGALILEAARKVQHGPKS